jgi:hypothetical protein
VELTYTGFGNAIASIFVIKNISSAKEPLGPDDVIFVYLGRVESIILMTYCCDRAENWL